MTAVTHLVVPEIQGSHGDPPPAKSLASAVVVWLGQLRPSRPLSWRLQIEGFRPVTGGFTGVRALHMPETNPRAVELRVRLREETRQWRCLLIAPTVGDACDVMCAARPTATAYFQRLSQRAHAHEEQRQASTQREHKDAKERKRTESSRSLALSLTGRASLREICHQIAHSIPDEYAIPRRELQVLLSQRPGGQKLDDMSSIMLVWRLTEIGCLEPVDEEGTHFIPTLLVSEYAEDHAESLQQKKREERRIKLKLLQSQLSTKRQELARLQTQVTQTRAEIEQIEQEIETIEATPE